MPVSRREILWRGRGGLSSREASLSGWTLVAVAVAEKGRRIVAAVSPGGREGRLACLTTKPAALLHFGRRLLRRFDLVFTFSYERFI